MDPRIEADFFNPEIRELPLDYVRDWYEGAHEPDGVPKETWTYLLPRVLEILASGEDASNNGPECCLSRFPTGHPSHWSEKQWAVLDCFQRRFLRAYLDSGPDFLDGVICMFRLGGWPLVDLLHQIESVPDGILADRLWRDWCKSRVPGRESVWITAFWKAPDNTAIFEFYTSHELRDRMADLALSDEADPALAAKASAVVSVIEANANWMEQKS